MQFDPTGQPPSLAELATLPLEGSPNAEIVKERGAEDFYDATLDLNDFAIDEDEASPSREWATIAVTALCAIA